MKSTTDRLTVKSFIKQLQELPQDSVVVYVQIVTDKGVINYSGA